MNLDLTANPPSGSQRALILSTPTGDDLPGATEARLRQARLFDHLDEVANQHVVEARALTSDRAAALNSVYGFYLCTTRLSEAPELEKLRVSEAVGANPHAYRRMRLGKSDEGPAAANRRPELKPTDQNGAGILADVPNRIVGNVIEARRIAPQLLGQLMSDTDVEFRDMVARDVPYQWLPAVVNGPDASVGFEIARSPLPEAPTALRHGPDRQVYLEAASCISAIELTNRAGGEGEVMRDLACDGSGMPACPLGSGA
ncbi:hypothetical protein HAP48_0024400 [Bradyrhizobium septentrionale]|uniref:Uncharacterized protein n=2 Tax=Bradyrhizobium TaxID=374 RepID=A0A973VW27_9BRAD|nr:MULTISPECIES: hypothetical protein [Bradyrhizobium]UGY20285.1 hypothetical protein HAP48_0024400 [Bradyrhizobium septentrionale]UGY29117.1 hypothetical protein HU675_0021665 [Bradyrhizobium septentrionale]